MGRPPKYDTPQEMQTIIDLYFLACRANHIEDPDVRAKHMEGYNEADLQIMNDIEDVVPTISGLAYTLGMSTEALRNYQDKENFLATVKRAKQRVEMSLEQRLAGHAVTGSIFSLKNNFGWKDKSEQELTGADGKDLIPQSIKVIYE